MKLFLFFIACLFLFPAAFGAAQSSDASPEKVRSLEERVKNLERDLNAYREKYAALDKLFRELYAVTKYLHDKSGDMEQAARELSREAGAISAEIDRTLEESRRVIEYLKEKVTVRPTLLLEVEAGWHALLGGMAGLAFVWEPLSWLSLKAGAELWYTDSLRPALPLSLTLRFRLD